VRTVLRHDNTRQGWMGFANLAATVINLRAADFSHRPQSSITIPNLRNAGSLANRVRSDRDLRCRRALAGTLVPGLELVCEGELMLKQEGAHGPASRHTPGDPCRRWQWTERNSKWVRKRLGRCT